MKDKVEADERETRRERVTKIDRYKKKGRNKQKENDSHLRKWCSQGLNQIPLREFNNHEMLPILGWRRVGEEREEEERMVMVICFFLWVSVGAARFEGLLLNNISECQTLYQQHTHIYRERFIIRGQLMRCKSMQTKDRLEIYRIGPQNNYVLILLCCVFACLAYTSCSSTVTGLGAWASN